MNVIFISPNFPTNYWQFCRELKNNGANVLGIGDAPYDDLTDELRGSNGEKFHLILNGECSGEIWIFTDVGIAPCLPRITFSE